MNHSADDQSNATSSMNSEINFNPSPTGAKLEKK